MRTERLGCVYVISPANGAGTTKNACAGDMRMQIQDTRGFLRRKDAICTWSGDWSEYNGIRTFSGCISSVIGVATEPAK